MQDGSREVVLKCYKCNKPKSNCNRAKNCKFDKKEDSSVVNSQEMVIEKFYEIKEKIKSMNLEESSKDQSML